MIFFAGLMGAATSAAGAGAARLLLRSGGYKIFGMTFFKQGVLKPDGYVNHQIFKWGINKSNYKIEWATTVGNKTLTDKIINILQIPRWHRPGSHTHLPLPPLSGVPVGAAMSLMCSC